MRPGHLYVSSTGVWLPERVRTAEAVAAGLCDESAARRTEIESVCVADEPGPDLAVRAGRIALRRSGHPATDIALLLHASAGYQGVDACNIAAYVQRSLLTPRTLAVELRQTSNGGMAAIELAAGYLGFDPSRRAALLTTGDRFALPGFDRWRADPGLAWGDGGSALVLSREPGAARLVAIASVTDPELEGMNRGTTPFQPSPAVEDMPADLSGRRRAFYAVMPPQEVAQRTAAGLQSAVAQALSEAEVSIDQIRRFVIPHFGLPAVEKGILSLLKVDLGRTTWQWGRTVGHLGAGDQFAGLDHLLTSGDLATGDLVLVLGVGAGSVWSCGIFELTGQ